MTSVNYVDTDFDANITEIGYDWKEFNMGTYQWMLDEDRMYFAKDKNEEVYKIVFTGFEGSASGNITFDITKL